MTRAERLAVRTSKRWVAGYPELVDQWHPTRNLDLFPDQVTFGSHLRIWWKCPVGPDHEWVATPNKRTGAGKSGCPFCAGQRVSVTNALAVVDPERALEWHPTKNGKLTARDVTAGSQRKVWWRCRRDSEHEWQCAPADKFGCPFCDGKQTDRRQSLAVAAPELAREWHPTRNGDLGPDDVLPGSRKRIWWRCSRNPRHVWIAQVKHRVGRGHGCPLCANRRPSRDAIDDEP